MILKVKQTDSSGKNKYEITIDNDLEYTAGTPWLEMGTPLDADNVRKCILVNANNSIIFSTTYNICASFFSLKNLKYLDTRDAYGLKKVQK